MKTDRVLTWVRTFMMASGAYTLDQINEAAPDLAEEIREIVQAETSAPCSDSPEALNEESKKDEG